MDVDIDNEIDPGSSSNRLISHEEHNTERLGIIQRAADNIQRAVDNARKTFRRDNYRKMQKEENTEMGILDGDDKHITSTNRDEETSFTRRGSWQTDHSDSSIQENYKEAERRIKEFFPNSLDLNTYNNSFDKKYISNRLRPTIQDGSLIKRFNKSNSIPHYILNSNNERYLFPKNFPDGIKCFLGR